MEHSNFSIISYSAHVHVKTRGMSAGLYVCFEIVKNMVPVAMFTWFIHVLGIKIKLLNLMP